MAHRDPLIAGLMEQFVCVRIVATNGLDLDQFTFDFDLTFAGFFMNADKTLYGRFGTRSARKAAARDISVEGLGQSMVRVLELHKGYPENAALFQGKRPPAQKYKRPERYPWLRRYGPKLEKGNQVGRSCIHCHQVGEAQKMLARRARKPMPDEVLFPWPMPNVLGIQMDPLSATVIKKVGRRSAAYKDGFRAGDEFLELEGQRMVSTADIQWVLHNAGDKKKLAAKIRRREEGKDRDFTIELTLEDGWRRLVDISWRATTFNLRQQALGGMVLVGVGPGQRQRLHIGEDELALRINRTFPRGTAGRSGLRRGDVIVEFDGIKKRSSEQDLLVHVLKNRMSGSRLKLKVLRRGRERKYVLRLPVQD